MRTLMTLLVVDPSPDVRTFLQRTLNRVYPEIVVIESPTIEAALNLLEKRVVTCVLTTFDLPDGNAHTLLAAAQRHNPPLPVVGMSSYADLRDEFIRAGAAGFLLKPFLLDQLTAMLEHAVSALLQERYR